jgi:hypothetical protein
VVHDTNSGGGMKHEVTEYQRQQRRRWRVVMALEGSGDVLGLCVSMSCCDVVWTKEVLRTECDRGDVEVR